MLVEENVNLLLYGDVMSFFAGRDVVRDALIIWGYGAWK